MSENQLRAIFKICAELQRNILDLHDDTQALWDAVEQLRASSKDIQERLNATTAIIG